MKKTPMKHQLEQAKAFNKGKNINQSEAGVGKTLSALLGFQSSNLSKLLVIGLAPKVQDFHEDGFDIDIDITPLNKGTKKNKELMKGKQYLAISFESSWRLKELLDWVDKDTMIIIDESHKVKSPTTKVAMFLEKLSAKASKTYLLTATFITNGKYEDSYQQLKIAGLYNQSFKEFKKQYCLEELEQMKVGGQTRYFNKIVGYKNVEELEQIIEQHSVYATRDKEAHLLPEDIFYYVKKPTMYGKLMKHRMLELPSGELIEYDNVPKLRHALLQLCSGVLKGIDKPLKTDKLDRVNQILTQHETERVVIFYNYDSEKDMLKDSIANLNRGVYEYNGSKKEIGGFQSDSRGVILVQYKSGSTGINDLVISSTTIYFSMCDSSTTYTQSKARTDRKGQTKKCIYYHLICENGIEKQVYETVKEGKDFTDKMLEKLLK